MSETWHVRAVASGAAMIVTGDIQVWLAARNAKARKAGGYLMGGRVYEVTPISRDTLYRIAKIIPHGAAAQALAALAKATR